MVKVKKVTICLSGRFGSYRIKNIWFSTHQILSELEPKTLWVGERQGSNVKAWLKLSDECESITKQKASEQAYPHSCVCPLRGHSRDCSNTHMSLVCSHKIRRDGRGFCLRHIRLCLKGKVTHTSICVKQTPSELQKVAHFFSVNKVTNDWSYIYFYGNKQMILWIKLTCHLIFICWLQVTSKMVDSLMFSDKALTLKTGRHWPWHLLPPNSM